MKQNGAEKSIVVIGGGTGSYTALTGLKRYTGNLTAVVAMTDSGGSSGRLRDEFGHLPPGDVRQCLVALCPDDRSSLLLRHLFCYRFSKGLGLNGHSFGNLFLTALTEITGSTESAIAEAGRILGIKGQVLPVTLTNSQLCARLVDGTEIIGEANIDVRKEKPDVRIDYLFLDPKAFVHPSVVTAMESADAIVIGPGDLYTSIIPNLLVDGVPEAIAECKGPKIYVCNLMTKHGESDGFKASDFIREVQEYLGSLARLDYTIVNSTPFPEKALNRYSLEKAFPVEVDAAECEKLVPHVVEAPLLSPGALLRHDPHRLAQTVIGILQGGQEWEPAPKVLVAVNPPSLS